MKLSSLPLFSEKSLVKDLVFLNLSLLYKGQNDSYNKFSTTKNYAGNDDMTKKEKEIYPRSRKEMLRIIKTAEKEGHLPETTLEEFTIHPFSMPALWDCCEYIWGIGQKNYLKKPLIISLLALLSTMAGRLDEAKDFSYNDFCRVSTELVMPYTDDFSFLRIVFFLIDVGAVPILSLTLSACRPSILRS